MQISCPIVREDFFKMENLDLVEGKCPRIFGTRIIKMEEFSD